MRDAFKSGAVVINYCWSSVESPWKRGGGREGGRGAGVDTWGATLTGTKACHEGPTASHSERLTLATAPQLEVRTT